MLTNMIKLYFTNTFQGVIMFTLCLQAFLQIFSRRFNAIYIGILIHEKGCYKPVVMPSFMCLKMAFHDLCAGKHFH